jgi:hypothetical protein
MDLAGACCLGGGLDEAFESGVRTIIAGLKGRSRISGRRESSRGSTAA